MVVVDPKLLELAKKLVIKELPLGTGSSMLKSIICDAMVQRGLALGEAVTKLEVILPLTKPLCERAPDLNYTQA